MANEQHVAFQPDTAVKPGETLLESIEALGISQAQLARRTNRPVKTINEIIKGKAAITPDTAIQLERTIGVPANFWNNLERNYRETLARIREEKQLKPQLNLVDKFPYQELARHGFVKHTPDRLRRTKELLDFFGIVDLKSLPEFVPAAFRVSRSRKASPQALASWLRIGEIEAAKIRTKPFHRKKFLQSLDYIRSLTNRAGGEFQRDLQETCANCGIALVLFQHLAQTYAHGAAKWISSQKALLQLSIRYKYADIFWFSFYHEAGHILLHGKRKWFADVSDMRHNRQEREANNFAANMLIPPERYKTFIKCRDYSEKAIRDFSRTSGIAPGIVVGRLQHDEHLERYRMLGLKQKLEWVTNSPRS